MAVRANQYGPGTSGTTATAWQRTSPSGRLDYTRWSTNGSILYTGMGVLPGGPIAVDGAIGVYRAPDATGGTVALTAVNVAGATGVFKAVGVAGNAAAGSSIPTNLLAKGVSAVHDSGTPDDLALVDASWWYNWWNYSSVVPPATPGIEYVPMIWGDWEAESDPPPSVAVGSSPILMGYNEPDYVDQANMTVARALELWPELEATGARLGSPAPSDSTGSGAWLADFMNGDGLGYVPRVDFLCLHWYIESVSRLGDLDDYLDAMYATYGLPIWLTEVGSYTSGGDHTALMAQVMNICIARPFVERIAWYSLTEAGSGITNIALVTAGGSLTTLGTIYAAYDPLIAHTEPVDVAGAIGTYRAPDQTGGTPTLTALTVAGAVGTFRAQSVSGTVGLTGTVANGATGAYRATDQTGGSPALSAVSVQGAIDAFRAIGIAGNPGAAGIALGAVGPFTAIGVAGTLALGAITADGAVGIYRADGVGGTVAGSTSTATGATGSYRAAGVDGSVALSVVTAVGAVGTYTASGIGGSVALSVLTAVGSVGSYIVVGIAATIDAGVPLPQEANGAVGTYRVVGVSGTTFIGLIGAGGIGEYRALSISGTLSLGSSVALGSIGTYRAEGVSGSAGGEPTVVNGALGSMRALGVGGVPTSSAAVIAGTLGIIRLIGLAGTVLGKDVPVRAGAFRIDGFAYEDREVEGMYLGEQLVF